MVLNGRWENGLVRSSQDRNNIAEATGLISFALGGHLQWEGFAVVVTALLFWLYEAA